MKSITIGASLTAALTLALVPAIATADGHKVTLCHATSSSTNPYVEVTVAKQSVIKGKAHDAHQDPGDIVPPFDGYEGRNWFDPFIGYYEAGCRVTDGDPDEPTEEQPDPTEEEPEPTTPEPTTPDEEEPTETVEEPEETTPPAPTTPVTVEEPEEAPQEPQEPAEQVEETREQVTPPQDTEEGWEPYTEVVEVDDEGREVTHRYINTPPAHLEQTG